MIEAQCEAIAVRSGSDSPSAFRWKTFNYIIPEIFSIHPNRDQDDHWVMQDYGGDTNLLGPDPGGRLQYDGLCSTPGDYSNPTYDNLVNDSLHSNNPTPVLNEIRYITEQLVRMSEPNEDLITAFKNTLAGPAASFEASSSNIRHAAILVLHQALATSPT